MSRLRRLLAAAALLLGFATASGVAIHNGSLDNALLGQASELSLASLEPAPADPTNRFAGSSDAAKLGERLFFDKRLSSNGEVSCATCHDPRREFQDGTPLAKGVGTTDRRTMPIAGTAHSPFLFWDGRKDSQWAQALGPLESP